MDHRTQAQPRAAGRFQSCGNCVRGWDRTRRAACDCYRAFLAASTRTAR